MIVDSTVFRNNVLRSCLILMLAVPAFAASPGAAPQGHMTTVVHADTRTGRLVRSIVMEPRVVPSKPVSHSGVSDPPPSASLEVAADLKVVRVYEGQAVKKGMILAEFSSPELESKRDQAAGTMAVKDEYIKALDEAISKEVDPDQKSQLTEKRNKAKADYLAAKEAGLVTEPAGTPKPKPSVLKPPST